MCCTNALQANSRCCSVLNEWWGLPSCSVSRAQWTDEWTVPCTNWARGCGRKVPAGGVLVCATGLPTNRRSLSRGRRYVPPLWLS